jgi:hypothetical protein
MIVDSVSANKQSNDGQLCPILVNFPPIPRLAEVLGPDPTSIVAKVPAVELVWEIFYFFQSIRSIWIRSSLVVRVSRS